ncbi:MAG: hypothetical protein HY606_01045 [Planctomycetes bacterium]|nr:hypothetical protein [Planctomycetota bacterium]
MRTKHNEILKNVSAIILLNLLKLGAISLIGLAGSRKDGLLFMKEVEQFTDPKIRKALDRLRLQAFVKFDPKDKTCRNYSSCRECKCEAFIG